MAQALELTKEYLAEEAIKIEEAYERLIQSNKFLNKKADKLVIRKAFNLAVEAHKDMRRKSGEAYIFHPIAVAQIVSEEIGLGTTSIICALLHDTVEDTEVTLIDIKNLFGLKIAQIIDGLTKISNLFDQSSTLQAENFRKMLLTISDDIRVIIIKIADRLHNMRTMESMPAHKQRSKSSETLFMFAPLAHRLGLYQIKSEMEDLGLKYTESSIYNSIETKLAKTKEVRERFINQFILPVKRALEAHNIPYEIKGRTKSIYSIWNKMKSKNIEFEEVYDVFAIRVILNVSPTIAKAECWRVYSIVTDYYKPNPERLRDWITTPKSTGYESLHTTVMSPSGRWVEVQIRSERMDKVAEKGYAAHWKYKNVGTESSIDEWINKVRDVLENPSNDTLDFIDDFKLNLFSKEIYIFTPKGELKNLPVDATALDFAFDIHTQVGEKCIGAKVNSKLVPLSHTLKSGDQVEIITSKKQKVKENWLNFVITGKAKTKIKSLLKEERRAIAEDGKEILARKFKSNHIAFTEENIATFANYLKFSSNQELFYRSALGRIDFKLLKDFKSIQNPEKGKTAETETKSPENVINAYRSGKSELVIGEGIENLKYKLASCCNAIPGDEVFGFVTINQGIKIHRVSCPNAIQLLSNYAYRIVKARWTSQENIAFMAGIKITGIDDVGIINKLTNLISTDLNVNMQSINFESKDGMFNGFIMVYVHDTMHLNSLLENIHKVDGVIKVERVEKE